MRMSKALPPTTAESVSLEDLGHQFRSKLIDRCAVAERWANGFICDDRVDTKLKPQSPLRQKLRALRTIADGERHKPKPERVFAKPGRVISLIDRFEAYAEIRTALAHATQSVSFAADGTTVFFYNPTIPTGPWQHLAITAASFEPMLREMWALVKELSDQQASGRLNPSSPHRPSPVSRADP
jgi:hypothetical protein